MGVVATVAAAVLTVLATLFVALAAHELGHVLGVRATGMQLRSVRVGRGPVVAHWRIGSVDLTICLGLGGLVVCEAKDARHLRRRVVILTLAGPVFGALVCLALAPWFGPVMALSFILGAVVNLLNLVPTHTDDPTTLGSDGLLIKKALRDDVELRLRFTLSYQLRLVDAARSEGRPTGPVVEAYRRTAPADDPTAAVLRLVERCLAGALSVDDDEVDEMLELLVACPDVPALRAPVAHLLNGLVYAMLEAGRRPPDSLVDGLVAALGVGSPDPSMADTLAWALADTGLPELGLRYSDLALVETDLSAEDRARCLAVNAICLAGTGAGDAARARRAEALATDPECALIEQVDSALGRSEVAVPPAGVDPLHRPEPADAAQEAYLDRWLAVLDPDREHELLDLPERRIRRQVPAILLGGLVGIALLFLAAMLW